MARRGMTTRQLEALCRGWPGVTVDIKWGADLVFSVAGKMFVITPVEGGRLTFKVEEKRFLELTDQPGIIPSPYLARSHWVGVIEPWRFATEELAALIRTSYGLVRARLTKKMQAALGPWPPEQDT